MQSPENNTLSGKRASQQPRELQAFIDYLVENDVRSYLEIGARQGDTFYQVMKALPKGSKGIAVDLPEGPWGGTGSKSALKKCIKILKPDYDVKAVFGDSSDVVDYVKTLGPFDCVFIDGDHRYNAVKKDFENYGENIVAFHDIDAEGCECGGKLVGAPKFWKEIRDTGDEWMEFVDPSDNRPMGIGVMKC